MAALELFSPAVKLKLAISIMGQLVLTFLDLAALLIFSILANLIMTGNLFVGNKSLNSFLKDHSEIYNLTLQEQMASLALAILILLVFRSLSTAIYLKRLNIFFAKQSARIFSKVLNQALLHNRATFDKTSKHELLTILNRGIPSIFSKCVGGAMSLVSDLALLLVILLGLFLYEAKIAASALGIFSVAFVFINRYSRKRINQLANQEMRYLNESKTKVFELVQGYKEFIFNSNLVAVLNKIDESYKRQVIASAKLTFLPAFSRYIYEAAFLASLFIVGTLVFVTFETRVALSVLATFTLATSRVVPALLRIQQQLNGIKTSLPYAHAAIELLTSIQSIDHLNGKSVEAVDSKRYGNIEVSLQHVSFGFTQENLILNDVSLNINQSERVAIVGESGAGKTTLLDLIAGLRNPLEGCIRYSGMALNQATEMGRVRIGYVPQDVTIVRGSLRENLLLERSGIADDEIDKILKLTQLDFLYRALPKGLDSDLGETARQLSGGERQRLGIARALISKPSLLLLDEFTSNLDVNTEKELMDRMSSLEFACTIIGITHRISTLGFYNRVVELREGRVIFDGEVSTWEVARSNFSN